MHPLCKRFVPLLLALVGFLATVDALAKDPEVSDGASVPAKPESDTANGEATSEGEGEGEEKLTFKERWKKRKDRPVKFAGIPVPMYSPATEWGLGGILMLAYRLDKEDTVSPPSTSALFGMGTSNGSWAAFGGQKVYFLKDNYRAAVGGGYGSFNSNYYGTGLATGELAGISFPLGTDAGFFMVRFQKRLLGRFYVGLQYRFIHASLELDLSRLTDQVELPEVPDIIEDTMLDSAIGLVLEYDKRDNQFSATRGLLVRGTTIHSASGFGSDVNYSIFDLAANGYIPITSEKYVIALRGFAAFSTSDTPVYSQPLIGMGADLRGYDHGRYRNDMVLTAQMEFRWNFVWRFGLVVFGGMGTAMEYGNGEDAPFLGSYGGGLRFNLHPKERLMLRVDYARGNDDGFFYFGVNEAF